eukprot:scaffold5024_cov136-Cylindrotheca_fusiformis.AAC.40
MVDTVGLGRPIRCKRRRNEVVESQGLNTIDSSRVLKLRGGGSVSKLANYVGESRSRCWAVLMLSILTDTISTTVMKMGRDEGSVVKLLSAYFGFFLSLSGLALAMGSIDVSIVYAVWAALGTAIVSIVGIARFGESYDVPKLVGLAMIIAGVVLVEAHS